MIVSPSRLLALLFMIVWVAQDSHAVPVQSDSNPSSEAASMVPGTVSETSAPPAQQFADPVHPALTGILSLPSLTPQQIKPKLMTPIESAIQMSMDRFPPVVQHLIPTLYGRDLNKIVGAVPKEGNEQQCSPDMVAVCQMVFPQSSQLVNTLQTKVTADLKTVLGKAQKEFVKDAGQVLERAESSAQVFLTEHHREALRGNEVPEIVKAIIKVLSPKYNTLKEQVAEHLASSLPDHFKQVLVGAVPESHKQVVIQAVDKVTHSLTKEAILVNLSLQLPGLSQSVQDMIFDQLRHGQ